MIWYPLYLNTLYHDEFPAKTNKINKKYQTAQNNQNSNDIIVLFPITGSKDNKKDEYTDNYNSKNNYENEP